MFFIRKNEMMNPMEILRIPQDFDLRKGSANTLPLYHKYQLK